MLLFLVDRCDIKTCAFRAAEPRSIQDRDYTKEGLFCLKPAQARYGMKQCLECDCRICYERRDLTERFEPALSFVPAQMHHFVNHYEVMLNCPVVSHVRLVFHDHSFV